MAALLIGLKVPGLDTTADTYFQDAITKAGLAYATIRTINASVSIIKESTVQLEPAGVGLSLAVGQVLDPIDDMTERLSHVLVTAIVSLGVQKLCYEIGVTLVPSFFAVGLLAISLLIWVEHPRIGAIQHLMFQVLLFSAIFGSFCRYRPSPMHSCTTTFSPIESRRQRQSYPWGRPSWTNSKSSVCQKSKGSGQPSKKASCS